MPGNHAVLSASSSDRWIHCPPSARLCEIFDDVGSDYAAEGTDAHTLCEYRLRSALGLPAEDPVEKLSWYSEEMEECAEAYVSYVLELVEAAKQAGSTPTVLIEQKVDFSRWVNEGFGTADCVVIANGTLNIVDYKHGKGVEVSAEENSQMITIIGTPTTPVVVRCVSTALSESWLTAPSLLTRPFLGTIVVGTQVARLTTLTSALRSAKMV